MNALVCALLALVAIVATVKPELLDSGDCNKAWEKLDAKDEELILTAEYAGFMYSKQMKQTYKDVLTEVIEGYKKPCRQPQFNFTAVYGISDCEVDDFDTIDCHVNTTQGLHRCKFYMWTPPGHGSTIAYHNCTMVNGTLV